MMDSLFLPPVASRAYLSMAVLHNYLGNKVSKRSLDPSRSKASLRVLLQDLLGIHGIANDNEHVRLRSSVH